MSKNVEILCPLCRRKLLTLQRGPCGSHWRCLRCGFDDHALAGLLSRNALAKTKRTCARCGCRVFLDADDAREQGLPFPGLAIFTPRATNLLRRRPDLAGFDVPKLLETCSGCSDAVTDAVRAIAKTIARYPREFTICVESLPEGAPPRGGRR